MLALKVLQKNKELTSQKLKTNILYQEKNILNVKASTDNLTQILNRCGLEEYFLSIVNTHSLSKRYFISAIFFDIDHFKSINETKGHGVGDEVLSELSVLIKKHTRSSDNLARWGGEEFIIICEQTMNKDAVIFAKKLCNIISMHKFSCKLTITASFGVYTERLTASSTLSALTDKADIALYEAKRDGRNNVKNYNDFAS